MPTDPGEPTAGPSTEVTLADLDNAAMVLIVDRAGGSRIWLAEGMDPGTLAKGCRRLVRSLEAHARALRRGRM